MRAVNNLDDYNIKNTNQKYAFIQLFYLIKYIKIKCSIKAIHTLYNILLLNINYYSIQINIYLVTNRCY